MTPDGPGCSIPGNRVEERRIMVEQQLVRRGIMNGAVLQSMFAVPRHRFVPPGLQACAYNDGPLPIGDGQTISQPYIVALMCEALELAPGDRVLEIGTGSGYAAAVLSRIVHTVYTIECLEELAEEAKARFFALKYDNIHVRVADGTTGWPEEAPFNGIMVSAGAPVVPNSLLIQLGPGGRLVIPVGGKGQQELLLVRQMPGGGFIRESLGAVCFVPLIGEEGWGGR